MIMLRSILLKTLRDLRGQVLVWGLAVGIPCAGSIAFFPSFQDAMELQEFVGMLPAPIQQLIGDPSWMATLEGFLKMKVFDGFLPLLLAMFTIIQGSATIAGEQERGTIDFLMAQPVTRPRVVLEKSAAIATATVGICAVISVAMMVGTLLAGVEADTGWLVLATFNVVPGALVFGGLALVGSCVFRRPRHAMMLSGAVLVWSIFLEMLAPMADALQPWRRLSVMYYSSSSLPVDSGLQWGYVTVLLVLAAVLVGISVWVFQRKELTV